MSRSMEKIAEVLCPNADQVTDRFRHINNNRLKAVRNYENNFRIL